MIALSGDYFNVALPSLPVAIAELTQGSGAGLVPTAAESGGCLSLGPGITERTTRYGKLISLEPYMDAEIVFLLCRYTTGDASGQNMVTIATDAMCRHIEAHASVRPRRSLQPQTQRTQGPRGEAGGSGCPASSPRRERARARSRRSTARPG